MKYQGILLIAATIWSAITILEYIIGLYLRSAMATKTEAASLTKFASIRFEATFVTWGAVIAIALGVTSPSNITSFSSLLILSTGVTILCSLSCFAVASYLGFSEDITGNIIRAIFFGIVGFPATFMVANEIAYPAGDLPIKTSTIAGLIAIVMTILGISVVSITTQIKKRLTTGTES